MIQINKKRWIWGLPVMTLFMSAGYLAFAANDFRMQGLPVPASVYWMSLLRGFLMGVFIVFVSPVLVKYTFGKKEGGHPVR